MKRKIKVKNVLILVGILVIIIVLLTIVIFGTNSKLDNKENNKDGDKEIKEIITDFKNMRLSKVEDYSKRNNLELIINYDYSDLEKDIVINSELNDNVLNILVSLGSIPYDDYKEYKVNELGKVPIMMYHGIVDTEENEYTGGNVDKDGYNRTSKAFLRDLEFYYEKGYRMVRLNDYVNGKINVSLGNSPIILTFDDGNANNFKVTGKDTEGNLIFDPNSAIGILESIKKKYPDYNVTATFFLNNGLCNQPEYNEDIIKWLINNGYDIGNHTTTHADFSSINTTKTQEVVGKLYQKLDSIIPGQYVKIIALPFGSPYKKTPSNYQYILNGEYNGYSYQTEAALRVGWEAEVSPFDASFDKTFLKRCRAYDNNGKDFDIEMNFRLLDKNRYISDGNINTIVIPKSNENKLITNSELKTITYEEDV